MIKRPPLPLSHIFSLLATFLHSRNRLQSFCKHLSLPVRTVLLSTIQTLSHTKSTASAMASSGKYSSSIGSSAQGSKRVRWAFSLVNLPVLATAIPTPSTGMGFNFLPPCPLLPCHSSFWKCRLNHNREGSEWCPFWFWLGVGGMKTLS